jgi:diaminohydroxyphosphoribosylaminopyrimidine deaminase/5-amino-6-(5-phosphoribosylamino)uracil reductase
MRIVLDNQLRIPEHCQLVKTAAKHPLLVVTQKQTCDQLPKKLDTLQGQNVKFLALDNHTCNLKSLLTHLSEQGIQQLLVEGGPQILASFMQKRLAQEIFVYICGKILGKQGSSSLTVPIQNLTKPLFLHHSNIKAVGTDARLHGYVYPLHK